MKKSFIVAIISALGLLFLWISTNSINAKATTVLDLKPLIEQAGSGTLLLKDKKDVTYVVNEPITNVRCTIQGAPGGSYVKANFKGYGNQQTPFLLRYQAGIHNISIKNVIFDLALIGRCAVRFEQNNNITIENSGFTGYSKQYGYNKVDSSISFTDCKNITIKKNRFFNNGYQYGKATNELNRSITLQGNSGDNYNIQGNEFSKVNQAIVIQGTAIFRLNIHDNVFNQIVDNSLYLLKVPAANIYNNDFNKGQKTSSPDEGIVLDGGNFKITNNRAYNVLNKFIAINGETKSVEVTNNYVKNEKTKTRPAVIAWRNNTAYTVQKLYFTNNRIDTDTAPANYDVIPIGKVRNLTIKGNKFTPQGLSNYQNVFSLMGQTAIDSVDISGNTIQPRKGTTISNKSFFLREKAPIIPRINHLVFIDNAFQGRYPAILNNLKGTIVPNVYQKKTAYITGVYIGPVVKARLLVNGVAKSWGGQFSKGIFKYYVGAKTSYKATDKIELVVYNANTKQLDRKLVKVK